MIRNFKTGRLGLSDPEIERERHEMFVAMCNRNGLDPDDPSSEIGSGHLYTPTEIHREQALWAMSIANAVLRNGGKREAWLPHAWKFQSQSVWEHDGLGNLRKYGYNKVQNQAYALAVQETDAIWEAQQERSAA